MVVVNIPSEFVYTNLYTLSGLTVGKSLIVTNNTSSPLLIVQSQFQPTINSEAHPIDIGETVVVHGTINPIWIRGDTGPVIVQLITETIAPFKSIDLPHDIYTNNIEGMRRPKISSEPSIAAATLNGFAYTISGTFATANNDYLAMNLSPASDVLIHKVVVNTGFAIEIYSNHATGTADGIFTAANMNLLSIDSSPTQGQLYSPATPVGDIVAADVTVLTPYVICGQNNKAAILVKNTSGSTATIKITVTFEEIGPRASSFGLTASTVIIATTEMSTFG